MARLIALDLAGGPDFVDALKRAWDDGDAVLPVDRRLPPRARAELLATARPHVLHDASGRSTLVADAPRLDPGDALVVASSGTTGTPKLIVHTRRALEAHARAVHARLGVGPGDRWLACLPLAHIGGLGVVLRSVLTDTPVDVLDGFDASTVAAAPHRWGSTLVSLVPTALDRIDPVSFRWIVLGGSADPGERPPNVVRTYGLTETGGGVVYGDAPLEGVEVRVDADGIIALRCAFLARGRLGPNGSVTSITDADGWFRTGDVGRLVGGGRRLVVDGRRDDLIVSGGQNVWPEPVEAVLRDLPGVVDVAVFGRRDPEWGERVVAALVAEGSAPSLDMVRDAVRRRLPAYAAPRELMVVPELPRTALGKLRRRALEDPRTLSTDS